MGAALRNSYPPPSRSLPVRLVSELLRKKGDEVWAIQPESSVYEAIEVMAERHCGALLVMRDKELLGIVSERDYARKVILDGRASRDTQVQDIMSRALITASPAMDARHCLQLMTE